MTSMLQFRDARVADIPAIVGLVTRAYRGEASRAGWTTEADLLEGQRIDPEVLRPDIQRHLRIDALAFQQVGLGGPPGPTCWKASASIRRCCATTSSGSM